jgi:hypothetical protein
MNSISSCRRKRLVRFYHERLLDEYQSTVSEQILKMMAKSPLQNSCSPLALSPNPLLEDIPAAPRPSCMITIAYLKSVRDSIRARALTNAEQMEISALPNRPVWLNRHHIRMPMMIHVKIVKGIEISAHSSPVVSGSLANCLIVVELEAMFKGNLCPDLGFNNHMTFTTRKQKSGRSVS